MQHTVMVEHMTTIPIEFEGLATSWPIQSFSAGSLQQLELEPAAQYLDISTLFCYPALITNRTKQRVTNRHSVIHKMWKVIP